MQRLPHRYKEEEWRIKSNILVPLPFTIIYCKSMVIRFCMSLPSEMKKNMNTLANKIRSNEIN